MPTTASQRSLLMEPPPEAPSPAHSRRHVGSERAGAAPRRRADVAAVLSLAGATANPAPAPIPQRVGGFGGAEGLAAYLARERIDAVIDATHPFAARMSAQRRRRLPR